LSFEKKGGPPAKKKSNSGYREFLHAKRSEHEKEKDHRGCGGAGEGGKVQRLLHALGGQERKGGLFQETMERKKDGETDSLSTPAGNQKQQKTKNGEET